MLQIVVPMAGAGKRFADAGFPEPKPLIPVGGMPMIQWVIRNLQPRRPHRFIFICQLSHLRDYDLSRRLTGWAPGCEVVGIDGLTEGAACTVLRAAHLIDTDAPLMIANSDQFIDADIDAYLDVLDGAALDGLIMTMKGHDPKWSFVALDARGYALEVAEKRPISEHATVGIYNFARGSDFARAAHQMIAADERVNGEFYVAPVYNQLIAQGRRIATHSIGEDGAGMHGLGTPADLQAFIGSPVFLKAQGLAT